MIFLKNAQYTGSKNRLSLFDLTIPKNFNGELILFIHGYMGFKDWGAWDLFGKSFEHQGFGFCKFNMTHNGGTIENGLDFPDLESFAFNTYSKEISDVSFLLTHLEKELNPLPHIHLVGHSRGGCIALLAAADKRITTVTTLSGISSITRRYEDKEMLKKWKETGVRYVTNQRTKQALPHYYVQYLDFIENQETLNIEKACKTLTKPNLVIHGDSDLSVPLSEGNEIANWSNSPLHIIEEADHVYGCKHPWTQTILPKGLAEVVGIISSFIVMNNPIYLSENNEIIKQLIDFSQLENGIKEVGFDFLIDLAKQLGLSKKELIGLFDKNNHTNTPTSESNRIIQFYRLCLMSNIDHKITQEELTNLRNIAISMGLSPMATEEVIKYLKENPGKGIPTNQLLQLFQANHN